MENWLVRAGKAGVRSLLRPLGYEVHRSYNPMGVLARMGIGTVLDVGAHAGWFAREIRPVLPEAWIHSFEPQAAECAAMQERMAGDRRFAAHALALGDREGEVTLHASASSPSSSLLRMARAHEEFFPHTAGTHPVTVRMVTLDQWAQGRELPGPILLKLDVQGFEDRVLAGAPGLLQRTAVILTEVSFVELYEGQILFGPLARLLEGHGFHCGGMIRNCYDPHGERILQADAFFFR